MAWAVLVHRSLCLSLLGHRVIRGSKCDPVAMLVEIIINKQNRCICNVRITPT